MKVWKRIRIDTDRAGNAFAAHVEWWHAGEPFEAVVWPAAPFADERDALEWAMAQTPRQGVLFP